jgi:hypothetical protein
MLEFEKQAESKEVQPDIVVAPEPKKPPVSDTWHFPGTIKTSKYLSWIGAGYGELRATPCTPEGFPGPIEISTTPLWSARDIADLYGSKSLPDPDQLALDFVTELKRIYTPPSTCNSCYGTGIYGFADQGLQATYEVCTSSACLKCPCGGNFRMQLLTSSGPDDPCYRLTKKCGKCGFSYTAVPFNTSGPRTQKAQSLVALHNQKVFGVNPTILIAHEKHLAVANKLKGYFYRPCPTKPRHGFVESRVCDTLKQVEKLWQEAREADPDAEIAVSRFISADCSAILVPESGVLALGPGHDGATSGKNSLMLPVVKHKSTASTKLGFNLKDIRKKAGIEKKQHVYLELIAPHLATYPPRVIAVQARSGPKLNVSSADYIPKAVTVQKVISPTDDLLLWEKTVADLKGKKGVVAFSKGATLACHAAVHCVAAKIPFITTKEPQVGAKLVPTTSEAQYDKQECLRGFNLGTHAELDDYSVNLRAAVGILHNAPILSASPHWSVLSGYMLGIIFKASALACLGEARHDPNISGIPKTKGRGEIWETYIDYSASWLAQRVARLVPVFLSNGFAVKAGYGGPKWSDCALQTALLYKALAAGDLDTALIQANKVVNASHNSGKLLTKFIETDDFNAAAKWPSFYLANQISMVWRVLNDKCATVAKLRPYIMRGSKLKIMDDIKKDSFTSKVALTIKLPKKDGSTLMQTRWLHWSPGELGHDTLTRYLDEL